MKKIDLKSQNSGSTKLFELFNTILELSDYNLNQFVKGDALAVPDNMAESFVQSLKEFVKISPDIVRDMENREEFWKIFEELDDYQNNNKFIKWIQRYISAAISPFEEAAFLREINLETFQKMAEYCFTNLVIRNIGRKRIDESVGDIKQLSVLRKIIFTFIDMVIVENYSKENAFDNMERIFGIKDSYCEVLWVLTMQNEDRLWKIMMMKQSRRVENKLNHLLEMIEE